MGPLFFFIILVSESCLEPSETTPNNDFHLNLITHVSKTVHFPFPILNPQEKKIVLVLNIFPFIWVVPP
jgi:hypothetical protein